MTAIDDAHVQSLVRQLDEAVPRDGHVEVLHDPAEPDEPFLRANRQGLLRLGIEFLKAAYAPARPVKGQQWVTVDLEYITGLEEHNWSFERREDVWSPISNEEPPGAASQILGSLLVLFLGLSLLIGAFTILRSLSRLISQ